MSKEVPPDVLKKIQVFWDMTPHRSVNIYWCSGGDSNFWHQIPSNQTRLMLVAR